MSRAVFHVVALIAVTMIVGKIRNLAAVLRKMIATAFLAQLCTDDQKKRKMLLYHLCLLPPQFLPSLIVAE